MPHNPMFIFEIVFFKVYRSFLRQCLFLHYYFNTRIFKNDAQYQLIIVLFFKCFMVENSFSILPCSAVDTKTRFGIIVSEIA